MPPAWGEPGDVHKVESEVGGVDVSDTMLLKALADENGRLKKVLAGSMLDQAMLK